MRIGYIDATSGCAGDMISAALAACADKARLLRELKKVAFPTRYTLELRPVTRKTSSSHGFQAYQFLVGLKEHEHHASYAAILRVFGKSRLDARIRERIGRVFGVLARAESAVHGTDLDHLHFHEVGQTDALVEIAAAVILLDLLGVEKLYASPIGLAQAAPATLAMAEGTPVVFREIPFEITTPTGMALLKGLAEGFGEPPAMRMSGHSFGTGTSEKIQPNVLTFSYGESGGGCRETVGIIETSVDDMNPALLEEVMEKLHEQGALEVTFSTAVTKKSRPMFLLRVLCLPGDREKLSDTLFLETTTIGLRYREEERCALEREIRAVRTKYGSIPVKIGFLRGRPVNASPEYDDCRKAARTHGVPLKRVILEALKQAHF
jgi:pyridinium-3,5-bisthiocarboxylic acid mononucleotide nickel chelatase